MRVITRLNVGGPAVHTILLTQALNDGQQFHSTLVAGTTAPHEGDMLDLATSKGVRPLLVPRLGREISPLDDLLALARMVGLVRALRPHVVHTHMAKAGTVGRLAAKLCRVPLVVHTYHGHVFHGYFGPKKTRLLLTIERALARLTDRIVVVGDRQQEEIVETYRVAPRAKVTSIPLGLELEPFLDAEQYRGALRAELGIASETPLIGIVARLVPIKAHEDFFEAVRRVHAVIPGAQFLVIGDGERRSELEALAGRLGVGSVTRFLGWRRDLREVYADLDVVVLSSHNEGSPVVLIEALAAARPVVSTAVGGVPEVVLDGQTGVTTPSRDPAALADGVLALLEDPERGRALGQAGRAHVYPRYSNRRLVTDVRELYLRELSASGRALPRTMARNDAESGGHGGAENVSHRAVLHS